MHPGVEGRQAGVPLLAWPSAFGQSSPFVRQFGRPALLSFEDLLPCLRDFCRPSKSDRFWTLRVADVWSAERSRAAASERNVSSSTEVSSNVVSES